jgi:hypothetical protein
MQKIGPYFDKVGGGQFEAGTRDVFPFQGK